MVSTFNNIWNAETVLFECNLAALQLLHDRVKACSRAHINIKKTKYLVITEQTQVRLMAD